MHAVYQCLLPFFLFHYSFKRSFSPRISLTTSLSFLNYRYNDPTSQCSFFFSSFLPFPSFAQRFQTKSINGLNLIQPCIFFLFLSLFPLVPSPFITTVPTLPPPFHSVFVLEFLEGAGEGIFESSRCARSYLVREFRHFSALPLADLET